jgi:hypothetical protein
MLHDTPAPSLLLQTAQTRAQQVDYGFFGYVYFYFFGYDPPTPARLTH